MTTKLEGIQAVYAFDPGKETGIAQVYREDGFYSTHLPEDRATDYFLDTVVPYGKEASILVACESIVITQQTTKKSSDVHASLNQIGVIKHACRRAGIPLLMQTPADAKSFSNDGKIKALGWWYKGSDHPRDAARHLCLAMCAAIPGFAELVVQRLKEPSETPVGFPPIT